MLMKKKSSQDGGMGTGRGEVEVKMPKVSVVQARALVFASRQFGRCQDKLYGA